jgi:hypothetical protein
LEDEEPRRGPHELLFKPENNFVEREQATWLVPEVRGITVAGQRRVRTGFADLQPTRGDARARRLYRAAVRPDAAAPAPMPSFPATSAAGNRMEAVTVPEWAKEAWCW